MSHETSIRSDLTTKDKGGRDFNKGQSLSQTMRRRTSSKSYSRKSAKKTFLYNLSLSSLFLHLSFIQTFTSGFVQQPQTLVDYSPKTDLFATNTRWKNSERRNSRDGVNRRGRNNSNRNKNNWFDDDDEEDEYGDSFSYDSMFSRDSGRKGDNYNRNQKQKGNSKYSRNRNNSYDENIEFSSTTTYLIKDETKKVNKAINCIHFDECPGCVIEEKVESVDAIESARLYFSSISQQGHYLPVSGKSSFSIIIPSSIKHWRTQAKLAVKPKSRWTKDGCYFGLYKQKSHDVLPIPECQVHHPSINRAVALLEKATDNVNTEAYDEVTGSGLLRYVQFQVERGTNQICLTLVMNARQLKECQPSLSRLVKEVKRLDREQEEKLFHSIWCHCNDSLGNAIFARGDGRWFLQDGPEFVREPIPDTLTSSSYDDSNNKERKDGLLFFNPMTFRQGNMDGFEAIAKHVVENIPPNSAVCELYAGVGLLGLTALSHHHRQQQPNLRWVRCSDENPANLRCFNRAVNTMPTEVTGKARKIFVGNKKGGKGKSMSNKKKRAYTIDNMVDRGSRQNNKDDSKREKVSYMVASAAKALYEGEALGADTIIVDPPRKGLESEVLSQLCKPIQLKQPPDIEDKRMLFLPPHRVNWANDATTLIYVSCGFDALAGDCDALLTSGGGWKIESSVGYVLFPGSNHLETVVVFKREGRTTR